MPGRNRQCRALAALLPLALPLLPQKAGHHLAHLPHQAARRTPGRLQQVPSSAVLAAVLLVVSLERPSVATLAGRLAVLLAASAAAISAALLVLLSAVPLALPRVQRWELRQPQPQHPQLPQRPPQQPVQGLALPQALLVVPQRVQRRALVPGRLAALLLAQRLVRWFQASERLLALASV